VAFADRLAVNLNVKFAACEETKRLLHLASNPEDPYRKSLQRIIDTAMGPARARIKKLVEEGLDPEEARLATDTDMYYHDPDNADLLEEIRLLCEEALVAQKQTLIPAFWKMRKVAADIISKLETVWAPYGPSESMLSSINFLVYIINEHVEVFKADMERAHSELMSVGSKLLVVMHAGLPPKPVAVGRASTITRKKKVKTNSPDSVKKVRGESANPMSVVARIKPATGAVRGKVKPAETASKGAKPTASRDVKTNNGTATKKSKPVTAPPTQQRVSKRIKPVAALPTQQRVSKRIKPVAAPPTQQRGSKRQAAQASVTVDTTNKKQRLNK
jgi:hypothetical protein